MRRHKSVIEDDDRPVRRVSYLRATANENSLQLLDSDMDNSPMSSVPPYTPETDVQPITQVLKRLVFNIFFFFWFYLVIGKIQIYSAYRPWRRPKITSDIQPLRKIFEETSRDFPVAPQTPPLAADSANLLTPSQSNLYLPMLVKTSRFEKIDNVL